MITPLCVIVYMKFSDLIIKIRVLSSSSNLRCLFIPRRSSATISTSFMVFKIALSGVMSRKRRHIAF